MLFIILANHHSHHLDFVEMPATKIKSASKKKK